MPKRTLTLLSALLLTTAALTALAGCGGGSGDSLVHIDGSSAVITRAMVNHWMRATAGGDFHEATGTTAPEGFVAEPADYGECETAARKVIPKNDTGKLKLGDAQIQKYCRELYLAIKQEVISFLITAQWQELLGKQEGLNVGEAQLRREFARTRKERWPTEAELRSFLTERHWSLADLLFLLKRNVLSTELVPKFQAEAKKSGSSEPTVVAQFEARRYKSLTAKTSCEAGYVSSNCREFKADGHQPSPPSVIFERLTKGEGG
jgi:hypothetical protein